MKNLIAVAIVFVIFLLYFIFRSIRQYKKLIKRKTYYSQIPKNWEKLIVDVEDCQILFREYYEEREVDESPAIISLLDFINAENKKIKSGISVVTYTHKFPNGEIHMFKSESIKADDVTVKYNLMNARTLSLFVDPLNRSRYVFKV